MFQDVEDPEEGSDDEPARGKAISSTNGDYSNKGGVAYKHSPVNIPIDAVNPVSGEGASPPRYSRLVATHQPDCVAEDRIKP